MTKKERESEVEGERARETERERGGEIQREGEGETERGKSEIKIKRRCKGIDRYQ